MSDLNKLADSYNSGKSIEPTGKKESQNLNEDAFFVLEHPSYKRVFVNPTKFSFLAFFWSIIFYAYYKRWLGLVLIIVSFFLSSKQHS